MKDNNQPRWEPLPAGLVVLLLMCASAWVMIDLLLAPFGLASGRQLADALTALVAAWVWLGTYGRGF